MPLGPQPPAELGPYRFSNRLAQPLSPLENPSRLILAAVRGLNSTRDYCPRLRAAVISLSLGFTCSEARVTCLQARGLRQPTLLSASKR